VIKILRNKGWQFVLAGFIFGLFFPGFAIIMVLQENGLTVNWSNAIDIHKQSNLFFIIELAPFVLAIVFGIIGKYMRHHLLYLRDLAKLEKELRDPDYNSNQKTSLLTIRKTYIKVFITAGLMILSVFIVVIYQFEQERSRGFQLSELCSLHAKIESSLDSEEALDPISTKLPEYHNAIRKNANTEYSKAENSGKFRISTNNKKELLSEEIKVLIKILLETEKTIPLIVTLICSMLVLCTLSLFIYTHFYIFAPNFMLIQKAILENTAARHLIRQQAESIKKSEADIQEHVKQLHLNLRTAEYIKKTLDATSTKMQTLFTDHFIVDKPLQTLSGDFFWAHRLTENKIVFFAGDCTGHGVAGSLLTTLYINSLEKIATQDVLPNQLLKLVDNHVKELIGAQTNSDGFTCEGAALLIDLAQRKVWYSGSNFDLYVVGDTTEMYKSQRFSIGSNMVQENPMLYEIDIKSSDWFVMASDGLKHMLNNKHERLGSTRIPKLLKVCANISGQKFAYKLENYIDDYRKDSVYTDDIMITGIRI
jgi:serine phosphatase RsbU (regulator of sigma subunit)